MRNLNKLTGKNKKKKINYSIDMNRSRISFPNSTIFIISLSLLDQSLTSHLRSKAFC